MISTLFFEIETRGDSDVLDITDRVSEGLRKTLIKEGLATIFVSGSTAGITTIEYEPGLVKGIRACFERLVPQKAQYAHEEAWHD